MLRILGVNLLQQVLDDLFFVVRRRAVDPLIALFQFIAFMDEQRNVTAIVHHQLRPFATFVAERLQGTSPVLFQRLAFPCEDGNAAGGNGRGGMVLRGENVAACPTHFRAQADQCLNQHGRLNGHVQRAGDANARQRFGNCVLVADRHQAGHFLFGNGDFFATPVGLREVGNLIVRCGGFQS